MKIWTMAYYTFLRHVRDVKAMIAFILLPIAMMLILGLALNNQFTPAKVDPLQVGYLNEDKGPLTDALGAFLKSEEISKILQLKEVTRLEEAKNQVKAGELKGLIHVPAGLSERSQQGLAAEIEFYGKEENSFVRPVLESFVRSYNLGHTLVQLQGKPLESGGAGATSNIREVRIATEGKIPRGIDYYAITTLFQSLLFGAVFGVFAVTKDIGNYTYSRLLASPVRPVQVTLGKLVGSTATLYAIALIIFFTAKYAFQANLNGSLWLMLVVILLFTVISVSIGMLLAFWTRSTMISALLLFVVSTVFTLVSGGFTRMEGDLVKTLSRFAPNAYSQDVLFTDIYEGRLVGSSLLGLAAYAAIVVGITFISGRRKLA